MSEKQTETVRRVEDEPVQPFREESPALFNESENEDLDDSQAPEYAQLTVSAHVSEIHSYKGTPISQIRNSHKLKIILPELISSSQHAVLVKIPLSSNEIPKPYPCKSIDVWDQNHVRLPCSRENLYPVIKKDRKRDLKWRWEIIKEALLSCNNCSLSYSLEEAILTFNTRFQEKWDFSGLHNFFTEVLDNEESKIFFHDVLPKMVALAIQMPDICTQGIPLLKQGKSHKVTFSQQQIACILVNAFFCTFPRRNSQSKNSEYSTFPNINFSTLYSGFNYRKLEKLKCIIHYFKRVTSEMPKGIITFQRQVLRHPPDWTTSSTELSRLFVSACGTIEDDGQGCLQVDFANKFLGGGVLRTGCVQEEIRFVICPELLVSLLITEVLAPNEALIITGCERFSKYNGYGSSFEWAGNYIDTTPRDDWGRLKTEIVAIDAISFRQYSNQFSPKCVKRELDKAFCGFASPNTDLDVLPAVATGNWGCGAFGGDLRLKALIQLLAAAEAGRDICYFTFGNLDLCEAIHDIHTLISEKNLQISDIWTLINQYYCSITHEGCSNHPALNLFEYINHVYTKCNSTSSDKESESDFSIFSPVSNEKTENTILDALDCSTVVVNEETHNQTQLSPLP